MNAVFIYGPPASGKLTVATELSKLSNYPLFHNHLTRDLVQTLYPENLNENYRLVDKLREDIFEYCARKGTDIIFTFVYDGLDDDEVVANLVSKVRDNGGSVLFVELSAPNDVLLDRVSNASRARYRKLSDRDTLETLLKESHFPSLAYPDIFKIDTSNYDPRIAAEQIVEHYGLA